MRTTDIVGSSLRPFDRRRAHRDAAPPPQAFYSPVWFVQSDSVDCVLSTRLDLHLLLNTLASSTTLRSSEAWIPICFPKFNPAGFVHAYVSYTLPDVGLVFVSADREAFEELRVWKEIVLEVSERNSSGGRCLDRCRSLKRTRLSPRSNNRYFNIRTASVSLCPSCDPACLTSQPHCLVLVYGILYTSRDQMCRSPHQSWRRHTSQAVWHARGK